MKRTVVAVALLAAMGAGGSIAGAHSDGNSCDEGSMGIVPILLDSPLGDYVHCHNDDGTGKYGVQGAVYLHVPGVGHVGVCTDTEQPLPDGFRLSPFFGAGDPSEESMQEQGCDPYTEED